MSARLTIRCFARELEDNGKNFLFIFISNLLFCNKSFFFHKLISIFRGDLAITLLVHYKDEPTKLARIMEKLLDRDVHQLIKTPVGSSYYTANPPTKSQVYNCFIRQSYSYNCVNNFIIQNLYVHILIIIVLLI